MNLILTKFKLPDSRKLVKFGKYFLLSLLLLLGLNLVTYANNPKVIIQPEWTADLKASTNLIATSEQLFAIGNQKYDVEPEDYSANLFAINIASGKVQWQQKLPSHRSLERRKLMLDNGIIYASHDDGILGFDPATGSPKASFSYATRVDSSINDRTIGISQNIAVYGDSRVLNDLDPNSSYKIEVFGLHSDKTIWSYKPDTDGMIGISVAHGSIEPLVQNGVLFLPSFRSASTERFDQFTVMDVATGKVLWTWEALQKPNGLWSANVFGDTIYTSVFGNSNMKPSGKLRAIDFKTGKEKWSYVITGKAKAVSDREVFVWQSQSNSGNNFVVLDKETGRFLRRFTLPRIYNDEPQNLTWSDGLIYAPDMEIKNATFGFYGSADNNSWVSAFDDKTGKLVWRTPTLMNNHIYHPPVVSAVADKSEKKRLIFASNLLGKEGGSKVQSFIIP